MLTLVGTSKDLKDVDTGLTKINLFGPGDYSFKMGIEFEVGVESHFQYVGCLLKR